MLKLLFILIFSVSCTTTPVAASEEAARCQVWRETINKLDKRIMTLERNKKVLEDPIEQKIISLEREVLIKVRLDMIQQLGQVCVF